MFPRTWKAQWRTLFIGFCIQFCVSDAQVTQTPQDLDVQEGGPFSLKCSYSAQYRPYFWYHQRPGAQPQLILSISSQGNISKNGFMADYRQNGKESNLFRSRAQLQDVGSYFCAVEAHSNKFTWGSGTRLIITPNLTNSEPSVYQLEDKKESNVTACLVTDFSPNPIGVKIKKTDSDAESFNGSVVVVKEDDSEGSASLGVVRWGKADDEFHCSATYQGKDYDVKEEKGSCSADEMSSTPVFETDERLNLLSLTVLGLRVIFIKSVALNLILTYRAWSR
ncbi:T cell receptor alpha chain MC.7.G5-like isoform 1-T1 [Liasis olivaceus]